MRVCGLAEGFGVRSRPDLITNRPVPRIYEVFEWTQNPMPQTGPRDRIEREKPFGRRAKEVLAQTDGNEAGEAMRSRWRRPRS